jgi:REP element-mobilizing transposase RayT
MEKFKNKYRIPSARLKNWDYGSPGFYFVTICTKNREWFFGDIIAENVNATACLNPTPIGEIANQYWAEIPDHFPFVELDEYVVMPNHTHGILLINKPDYKVWNKNKLGPQSENLGSVIRGYKAGVKTFATTNQIKFGWQPRFHDRVIRSEGELNRIRKYIIDNPLKWSMDHQNKEGLLM